jgi:multisubunit Na+/H+ antiporter MnhE subunit
MTENYRIKELILRIMRFTMCQAIIIMVFTGIIHAHVNLAQGVLNQNIAVKVENVKLKAALTQLEKRSESEVCIAVAKSISIKLYLLTLQKKP